MNQSPGRSRGARIAGAVALAAACSAAAFLALGWAIAPFENVEQTAADKAAEVVQLVLAVAAAFGAFCTVIAIAADLPILARASYAVALALLGAWIFLLSTAGTDIFL